MKKIQFFLIFLIFSSSFQYKGVDLSEYEGDVDWSRLSPNIDFSILRANWKIGIDENQFENNYAGAKNYGVSVGAYWYSYAHNEEEAAKEAKDCLDIIKGKQFEYPIFYYNPFTNQSLWELPPDNICLDSIPIPLPSNNNNNNNNEQNLHIEQNQYDLDEIKYQKFKESLKRMDELYFYIFLKSFLCYIFEEQLNFP